MSTNVLLAKFAMTNVNSHILPASTTNLSKHQDSFLLDDPKRLQLLLVIALTFMGFAGFITPEKPNQLASICEKHNSINACQVW